MSKPIAGCLALVLSAGLALPALAAGDDAAAMGTLALRAGTFPASNYPNLMDQPAVNSTAPVVLVLGEPMNAGIRDALTGLGVVLDDYLSTNAYIARVPAGTRSDDLRAASAAMAVAFDPAWKIAPTLGSVTDQAPELADLKAQGKALLRVHLFQGADTQAGLMAVAAVAGVDVFTQTTDGDHGVIVIAAPVGAAADLAAVSQVQMVEDGSVIEARSNSSTEWVLQSNVTNQTPLWAHGLTGNGQILGHIDGWVAVNHCAFVDLVNPIGPNHRKILAYNADPTQYDLHGTHTAGTALGNPDPSFTNPSANTKGMAYNAKMVFSTWPDFTEPSVFAALSLHESQGARVHSNSWGDDYTTDYDGMCRGIDNFCWLNDTNLVCFAVSDGTAIKNPENSKNCLAVTASNQSPTYCVGGVGPTKDLRVKPELMAPGCNIASTVGSTGCGTGALTGTSMACPAIAGLGLLFRQYFTDGYYPSGVANAPDGFEPSGALLKAALINSAYDITGIPGFPSNKEGWGRPLGDNAVYFKGDARGLLIADAHNNSAQGLKTGDGATLRFRVNSSSQQLKITLVWHDYPASVNASQAAVNNLDLEVDALAGGTYLGNNLSSGVSRSGGMPDSINNVEQVILNNPTPGVFAARVLGTAVNMGTTQGYGLVVTGDVSAVCLADFNGDGFADMFDFNDFIDAFENGSAFADVNGDGFIDIFDFVDFIDVFEAGC